jgi:hypothetical protein
MQETCFGEELEFLRAKDPKKQIPILVNNLNLFLDKDQLIRTKGRISKALYFNFDVKNPILFHKNHHLTTLVIRQAHSEVLHLGLASTLNLIRTKGIWITRARQSVKNELSKCVTCKKYNSFSFKYPKLTNITKSRVNFVHPFSETGVDHFGPVYLKDTEGKPYKMYVIIFSCMQIRCIHLELVPTMSTADFLLAFKRFCNMYSSPNCVYSDNARSLVQGGEILQNSLISTEFSDHLKENQIKHIKISLYSPWVGSCYERMIRVVKNCFYKVVGKHRLEYFEMLTLFSQIKNVINNRPLTYRSEAGELEILTPNSFLKLYTNTSLILRPKENENWGEESNRNSLTNTLKHQEALYDNFRRMWYEDYLLSLREQSRNLHQSDWVNRIRVGDVVLIRHPSRSRPFWDIGRITSLIFGEDGIVRSVNLKQGDGKLYLHSLKNLFPLELSLTHNPQNREL